MFYPRFVMQSLHLYTFLFMSCDLQYYFNYKLRHEYAHIHSYMPYANAWSSEGHEACGMTAMSAIRGAPLAQIKRIMGGKDVVDIAAWGHKVNNKFEMTKPFHFQYQPKEWHCETFDDSHCPDNKCLLKALNHFYAKLTGQKYADLKYPHGLEFTDADAVKYLVNLLEDLHQPLNVGFLRDHGGKDINITYKHTGGETTTTLYDYWNSDLILKFIEVRSHFWYGGWTHINTLGKEFYHDEKRLWDSYANDKKYEMFLLWAAESLKSACQFAYVNIQTNQHVQQNSHMTVESELASLEEIKRRILKAGTRTAIVLNSILEQRDASRLRQGSGIAYLLEANEKQPNSMPIWMRNLAINFACFIIIGGLFLYITKYYSPSVLTYKVGTSGQGTPLGPIQMKEMKD